MNVFKHAHFQCKDIYVLSAVRVRALLPVKKSILFSYFYFCYCQDFISCIGVPERFIVRRYFQELFLMIAFLCVGMLIFS